MFVSYRVLDLGVFDHSLVWGEEFEMLCDLSCVKRGKWPWLHLTKRLFSFSCAKIQGDTQIYDEKTYVNLGQYAQVLTMELLNMMRYLWRELVNIHAIHEKLLKTTVEQDPLIKN